MLVEKFGTVIAEALTSSKTEQVKLSKFVISGNTSDVEALGNRFGKLLVQELQKEPKLLAEAWELVLLSSLAAKYGRSIPAVKEMLVKDQEEEEETEEVKNFKKVVKEMAVETEANLALESLEGTGALNLEAAVGLLATVFGLSTDKHSIRELGEFLQVKHGLVRKAVKVLVSNGSVIVAGKKQGKGQAILYAGATQ